MHQEALTSKGKEIFSRLKEFPQFYLAGGTALALQIGHRISYDFDLFSNNPVPGDLYDEVKKIFRGRELKVSVSNSDEQTFFIDGVKLTFLKYPFPPISDTEIHDGVNILSVSEIASAKAYAIGRRGEYRDYIDIHSCLISGVVSLDNIIKVANEKYGDEFNSRLFLEQLIYLDDVEETPVIFLDEKYKVDKKQLQRFLEEKVKEIEL